MTKRKMHSAVISLLSAAIAFQLAGCGKTDSDTNTERTITEETEEILTETADEKIDFSENNDNTDEITPTEDTDSEYHVNYSKKELTYEWEDNCTKISADEKGFKVDGPGAMVENNVLKITDAGTYLFNGKAEGSRIIIDSQDEKAVRLVFKDFSISSSDDSPVYARCADKVIITLAKGSVNSINDTSSAAPSEDPDAPDAALFCKCDLSFNGEGKLYVVSANKDGITSKDELKVISGIIAVKSADDGIKGRDLVAVRSGEVVVESEGDGIKSSNDKDETKGNIIIENGKIEITSGGDGVQAEKMLAFLDGELSVVSGGGYENGREHYDNMFGGGRYSGMQQTEADSGTSSKGMKSGGKMIIASGSLNLNCADDALHSKADLEINGGDIAVMTGDDGVDAGSVITINGGNTVISSSYEGLEAEIITINDGTVCIKSSDDGMNASSDNMSSQMKITINGGNIYVDADGDGLDSNGDIEINDGYVIVSGPVSNFNGPLDCGDRNNRITVNGGVLAAFGSSGMFEIPDVSSAINSVAVNQLNAQPGTLCSLADSEGNVILAFTCSKTAQAAVISSPEIKTGEKYIFYKEGIYNGTLGNDGTGCGGTISGGTEAASFEITSPVTVYGRSGGGNRRGEKMHAEQNDDSKFVS